MIVTREDILRLAPRAKPSIASGILESAHWLDQAEIVTPMRLSHFMAQTAQESDGFATTVEYASGAAYEGRRDLGNTRKGDGKRFRGRGLIQCTGRANYRAFTAWCRARGMDSPDFEARPETVAQFPWAFISAVWYWDWKGLNRLADKGDLRAITRKINGGTNGLADRQAYFRRAWEIWGTGEATRFAGAGKPLWKSRESWASAVLGSGGIAGWLSGFSDVKWTVREFTDGIRDWLPDTPTVSIVMAGLSVALVVFLLRERARRSKEYDD